MGLDLMFELRAARPGDEGEIHRLVKGLAEYEKLADEAVATPAHFAAALFGAPARCEAMLAEIGGKAVGFALWFYNFSTFRGHHGLYVEDVFVEPDHRGLGIGRAFFAAMARRAVEQNCPRMEWSVLDWNTPAIDFYRKLGAVPMQEWTIQRLTGQALTTLANG